MSCIHQIYSFIQLKILTNICTLIQTSDNKIILMRHLSYDVVSLFSATEGITVMIADRLNNFFQWECVLQLNYSLEG